ncbi:MAG: radical SAM protein [Elusimicrobiota bacterium]
MNGQFIDGNELARRMGIGGRPCVVDFDTLNPSWSRREDRYSSRQLAALWRESLQRPGVNADFPVAFYIHVPFCTHTCSFCRCFFMQLKSGGSRLDRYVDYLCDQMEFFAPVFASVPVRYFSVGGGTPSLLSAAHWRRLFSRFHALFDIRRDSPLSTFEMSLPTMRDDILDVLSQFQVPRVSVGVQTLDAGIRRASRMFAMDPQRLTQRVAAAKRAGLRVNLDLVLGLPNEKPEGFLRGFETLLEMRPGSVCVNILSGNYFNPDPGSRGSEEYLATVATGMAKACARAGFEPYADDNGAETILCLSSEFDKEVRPHVETFRRISSGVLAVKAGTSTFAFGSICSLALMPDLLISCFDQDYDFDPDKIVYQVSHKEVFSILYPRPEDASTNFSDEQRRVLERALRRLRSLRGVKVEVSQGDVLLEFSDAAQQDKRGTIHIRAYEEGRPCFSRVGTLAVTYRGELSSATDKVLTVVRRSLEEGLESRTDREERP